MRRLLSIAVVVLAAAVVAARSGMQAPEPEGEKKLIDLKSDLMGPIAPGDSVVFLVGNFAAQHNGAVITCDSAVRYSDMRIEFFGNVLINKNTTYIYGDRAEYDGELNEARVYSDIVKVVDGDATLYTYKFLFNTKKNIGEFADGGVMLNRENLLESVRGYYYADTKELIAVDRVEMRNDEYELKGDSVVYNMATDNAFFFDRTNIWNKDGDYLYADRGSYDKADTLYIVTRNGYILTEKQEIWSDSLHYYRAEDHVILRRDLQLDDAEHKVIAFGDYGEYWKEPGNAFLTRRPAVVSYDLSQGDSLFMRADSMYLFTINENALRRAAAAAKADSLARLKTDSALLGTPHHPAGELPEGRPAADSLGSPRVPAVGPGSPEDAAGPDSLARREVPDSLLGVSVPDSLAVPAVDPLDTLVGDARKAYLKEQAAKLKAAQKAAAAKARKEKLEEIAKKRQDKTTAKLLAQKEREERRLAARKLKAESKLRARQARAARKGKVIPVDSTALREIDSLIARNDREMDSLLLQMADSLAADSLAMRIPADSVDSLTDSADSVYRLMKGFRNVRIFRSDFQAVCDSMTAISTDSTIHLYINPVLWNQGNQITSDVMDIFTENQQITRAEFIGTPMMVSQLDTVHYNQVAGKQMTAWFRDNQIYRNDVNGNGRHRERRLFVLYRGQTGRDDRLPQGPRLEHLSDGQDSRRSGALPQGVQVGGRAASDAGGGFRPQGPALAARGEEASRTSGFPASESPRGAQEAADRGAPLGRPQRSGRCRHRGVDAGAGLRGGPASGVGTQALKNWKKVKRCKNFSPFLCYFCSRLAVNVCFPMKKSLIALAFGTLALGMAEFVMMGILPDIARSLGVSIPEAGHLISAYALGVCFGAPLTVLVARTRPLKHILLALTGLIILGNACAALSPNYWTLLAMRFVSGLPHGAFFGVGSIVAERVADKGRRAEAVSIMVVGMTVANLFGVPLGTYISGVVTWRATFGIVAVWGAVAMLLVKLWVPALPALPDTGMKGQFRFLKSAAPWLVLASVMLGNGGIFCWYSYVSPLMVHTSGFRSEDLTLIVMLAGFGMFAGNIVGGHYADRFTPERVVRFTLGMACLALVGIFFGAHVRYLSLALMCLTTACLFCVSSPQQLLILENSRGGEMLGAALVQVAFNLGNALGAYVGGLPIGHGLGYEYTALPGAAFVLLGMTAAMIYIRKYPRHEQR